MTTIKLEEDRRARLVAHLQSFFRDEFDENLSEFRAGEMIAFLLRTLGPEVYNQAVQDVRGHLQVKLDDLDGEVYADSDL